MPVMSTDRRYRMHDRVVGHAWAEQRYRLKIGTVMQVYAFMPPPGYKTYQVRWTIDEEQIYSWHDERELSPLRTEGEG